jgi:predicted NodU family carbamoyl transferase
MQPVLFSLLLLRKQLVLTADGVGEWATTTVAVGKGNDLDSKKEIQFPHSLRIIIFGIYLLHWI